MFREFFKSMDKKNTILSRVKYPFMGEKTFVLEFLGCLQFQRGSSDVISGMESFQERENWEKVMKIKGPCHCCDGPSITGWELSEIKSQSFTRSNQVVFT